MQHLILPRTVGSTDDIIYRNTPLPELPHEKRMNYLGMLVTLKLDYKYEKAKIRQAMRGKVAMLGKAKLFSPSQKKNSGTAGTNFGISVYC
jgi:hypothetical protein